MRLFIASDIHGSAKFLSQLLDRVHAEKPDKVLLLGDLLYHGPRNDLPDGYNPKEVAALLNENAQNLLCVRGNCEAEVDQMMLSFPVLSDSCLLFADGVEFFLTHGHHHNPDSLPPLKKGNVLLTGHTHIPHFLVKDGVFCVNPGSVSIPKANSPHSYRVWENGVFTWKDLSGAAYAVRTPDAENADSHLF